ncbi:MAG: DUF1801 domain-containing protein [Burkholderiaceae bacterium]|nr:DUF1801 domain-containing protein [Burkholderiaceae bacterium]
MAEAKTRPTPASIDDHLASRASAEQLADCRAIMALCERVTGQPPRMWGPSIIGYGSYSYRYASGRTGESCLVGLAVRGRELVVYLMGSDSDGAGRQAALLARLGKHKLGKACLYLKRLADVDAGVLEALIAESVAEIGRRHPTAAPPG